MHKLSDRIQQAIANIEIESLNEMQLKSLKLAGKRKDMVLLSPTGSGKTLAFLLPILNRLDPNKQGIQAMILAPSRELALQIEQVFRSLQSGFKVSCFYGGHPFKTERASLAHPPAVLVGTPGRVADHVRRETFDTDTINTLVLDEFDKALDLGYEAEMITIIGQLANVNYRILTSATKSESIPLYTGLEDYKELNYLQEQVPQKLAFKMVRSTENDKLEALFKLVCTFKGEASLVFCNHRDSVDRISDLLKKQGLAHDTFHGGMEQEERERALIKFRSGSHQMLIATDLASRGLDIPEIKHVVHYQLPLQADQFVHRNGRTARMFAEGTAYLVLRQDEPIPEFIEEKPEELSLPESPVLPEKPEWTTLYIGSGKKEKISKGDIAGLLIKKGHLEMKEIGRIEVLDHTAYVAVSTKKAGKVVHKLKDERIKRKKIKISISR
ncbi:DEAD/DEAH box helicase [Puteibacter caeruleilacunae]|nr:DEAD/DEAH box helicase [Puteibacter caeruleilacunae]